MIECGHSFGHERLDNDEVARERYNTHRHRMLNFTKEHIAAYLIETPKHLIAMAASKNTAAFGKVISAIAKKDARRWGALTAHNESR